MKNSIDITRGYQIRRMLFDHITAVIVAFIVQTVAFWYFLDKPVIKYVVSGIFVLVYAYMIYNASHRLATRDSKSYTPLEPNMKWGVIWGVVIAVTMLAAAGVHTLNYHFFSTPDGLSLNNWGSVIVNVICIVWMAPYMGFIFNDTAGVWLICAAGGIVSIAASAAGYWAGMKNIDILMKLDAMTVEKKDDDDDEDEL